MNIAKFLKTLILKNTYKRLFLSKVKENPRKPYVFFFVLYKWYTAYANMMITTKAAVNAAETKPICALDPVKKKHVDMLSIVPTILAILGYNFKNCGGFF